MSDRTLKLKNLSIRHFLGIINREQGYRLPVEDDGFSYGVNIIYGANATGKTTTAHAIQELLWTKPDNTDKKISLSGEWQYDDSDWEKHIEAGHITLLKDGDQAAAIPLPPAEEKPRYHLDLPDLLASEDRNLAMEIQNELYGGIDLHKAAVELGFQDKIPAPNSQAHKRLKEAQKHTREIRKQQAALQEREKKISALQKQIEKAKHAQQLSDMFRTLLEYQELTKEKQRIQETLDSNFPPQMKHITGEELKRFSELTENIDELQEKIKTQEKRLGELNQDIQDAGLNNKSFPSKQKLNELQAKIQDELEPACQKLPTLEQERARLKAELASKAEVLGEYTSNDKLENITQKDLARFAELARSVTGLREREMALKRVESLTTPEQESDSGDKEAEKIRGCLDTLLNYAAHGDNKNIRRLRKLLFSTLITFTVLITAIVFIVNPIWLIALTIPAAISVYLIKTKPRSTGLYTSETLKECFQRSGIEPPASWEPPEIAERIFELADMLQKEKFRLEKQNFLKTLNSEREELRKKLAELENEKQKLAEEKGIDLRLEENHWSIVAQEYYSWRQLRDELAGKENESAEVRAQRDTALNELQDALQQFTTQPLTDHAAVKAVLNDIMERAGKYQEAVKEQARLRKDNEELRVKLEKEQQRREEICRKAGFDPDEGISVSEIKVKLKELVENLANYSQEQKRLDQINFAVEERKKKLDNFPDFDNTMFDLEFEEINSHLEQAEQEADSLENRRDELSNLKSEIDQVKQKHDLEEAVSEENEARFQLRKLQQETTESIVGHRLIGYLENSYSETASRVLGRAKEFFGKITNHAWELEIEQDNSEPVFSAREKGTGYLRNIDELSSGTRVQLLLAVRVAFIDTMEEGAAKVPLILDEVLANSDNERSTAVIEALSEIAEDGRQIFYFTARKEEVRKCQDLLSNISNVDFSVFEMPHSPLTPTPTEVERHADKDDLDDWQPRSEQIPPPEGRDYFDYAALLEVPPPPLHNNIEALHLWYLLDNPALLYRFLQAGYRYWGQVKQLLAHGGANALRVIGIENSENIKKRLQSGASIIGDALELWRQGRGHPVTMEILNESPFANHQTLPDLIACARETGGDAEKLLATIENGAVSGFGRKRINKLRDYLSECGCLDDKPLIPPEELSARIDARASEFIENGALSYEQYQRLRNRLTRILQEK